MPIPTPPEPFSFLTTLLPLIFTSAPEALPPTLLSKPTRLAHQYLAPEIGSSSYYCLSSREEYDCERLRENLVTDAYGEWNLGKAEWEYDPDEGEIRARVGIGREGLCIILLWEEEKSAPLPSEVSDLPPPPRGEEEADRPAWTFQTLSLLGPSSSSSFKTTLQEAMEIRHRPPAINIPSSKIKQKDVNDMAQGEGTTPGAYGAAEDFWQGWNSEEEDSKSVEDESYGNGGGKDEAQDAEDYWGRYGDVEDQIESGKPDEFAPPLSSAPPAVTSVSRPASITRSRRSSTIKPPLISPSPSSRSFSKDSSSSLIDSGVEFGLGSTYVAASKDAEMDNRDGIKTPDSPPLQPTLFSAFPSALNLAGNGTAPASRQVSEPTSPLSPTGTNGINGHSHTKSSSLGLLLSGNGDADAVESHEDESLRFALAGLWQLYSGSRGGSGGEEMERKREKWSRIASMVTRS